VRDLERALAKDMSLAALKDELVTATLARTFLSGDLPLNAQDFARRLEEGRNRLGLIAQEMQRLAAAILAERAQVEKRVSAMQKAHAAATADVREQLSRLLAPGFLARTPWERLQHFLRYLKAAAARLDKLRSDPARDASRMAELSPLEQAWRRDSAAQARMGGMSPDMEQFRWLLEELRVSLFAQELKTPVPVSAKRLARLWQSMRK
jgi:ATP-dependent helicase HrpA